MDFSYEALSLMEAVNAAKAENDAKKKAQRKKLVVTAGILTLSVIAGYIIFRNIKK